MKTQDIINLFEANGMGLRREQYVIRSVTRPGWQGRPKGCLVCGWKWNVHEYATGKAIVSRPTPAAVLKWVRENRPELLAKTIAA